MKIGMKISLFPAVCLIVCLVLVLYCLLYFIPSQSEIKVIRQEIYSINSQEQIYAPHLTDHSVLEGQIDQANAQIEELHKNGYTNDGSVNLIIGEAILAFGVELNSISIGETTVIEEYNALPINLKLSGDEDKLLSFVEYFENNEEGSFLVYYANLDLQSATGTLELSMYLCTPQR